MIWQFFLLIIGFSLLIKGADWLVEGAAAVARKFRVSELVIGLTIVAFGTSAPELAVNGVSAIYGNTGIALGNVLGSNLCNILLILGISTLIRPLPVEKSSIRFDIPLSGFAIILLIVMGLISLSFGRAPVITRMDGLVLLVFFGLFMARAAIATMQNRKKTALHADPNQLPARYSVRKAVILGILGLVMLTCGGRIIVASAVEIAAFFGMTERIIGLTVVAIGTSLPELAASAIAAWKNKSDIAVGNVVGSNIFNIFLILGVTAVIKPVSFAPGTWTDLVITALASGLLLIAATRHSNRVIQRSDGLLLVACYLGYISWVLISG